MPTKFLTIIVAALVTAICLTGCGTTATDQDTPPVRGIYHWKTTYNPTPWELQFLKEHNIQRLYIRLFDVAPNPEYSTDYPIIPIATTYFLQPLPDSMEIVPCIYITNDALKQDNQTDLLAARIHDRIFAMSDCNGFSFREVQLDCDWTTSTRDRYYALCKNLRQRLAHKKITLSSTMRLYQLTDTALSNLPVDRTTLMCYNLGGLQDYHHKNSILEYSIAKQFLKLAKSLPQNMDVAYPTFGWGVAFTRHNGEYIYSGLLHYPDINDTTFDHIREEHGEISQITQLKDHLASIYHDPHTTIIYHLDSASLSYYTHDEIEQILSR